MTRRSKPRATPAGAPCVAAPPRASRRARRPPCRGRAVADSSTKRARCSAASVSSPKAFASSRPAYSSKRSQRRGRGLAARQRAERRGPVEDERGPRRPARARPGRGRPERTRRPSSRRAVATPAPLVGGSAVVVSSPSSRPAYRRAARAPSSLEGPAESRPAGRARGARDPTSASQSAAICSRGAWARYHSIMVNSGSWWGPRSSARQHLPMGRCS